MLLDLSPHGIAVLAFVFFALLVLVVVVCSGTGEELDAGLAVVLTDQPEPEPAEAPVDFLPLSPEEIDTRFNEIVGSYGERPILPPDPAVYDIEAEGGL